MKRSIILLLHIGYWLLYVLLLAFILGLLSIGKGSFIFLRAKGVMFFSLFALVPAIICFYTFYTLVFQRWLSRKKIAPFIIAAALIPVGCACIGWLLLYAFWQVMVTKGGPTLYEDGTIELVTIILIMSLNTFANGIIALVMKGFITWYGDISLKRQLEQKNYETELALVKSQINPHFLFNTLNNIDVLIESSPATASAYLQKLSGIMRFMLYETKTETIPLEKELSYIQKYIDLQKIRTSNTHFVQYDVTGNATGHTIAPMLLIAFVENAFKHAENKKTGTAINILVDITATSLFFTCENAKPGVQNNLESGGLGNALLEKRLHLLYPGMHRLAITNNQLAYTVNLTIFFNAH